MENWFSWWLGSWWNVFNGMRTKKNVHSPKSLLPLSQQSRTTSREISSCFFEFMIFVFICCWQFEMPLLATLIVIAVVGQDQSWKQGDLLKMRVVLSSANCCSIVNLFLNEEILSKLAFWNIYYMHPYSKPTRQRPCMPRWESFNIWPPT